jgi:hypothetical protein
MRLNSMKQLKPETEGVGPGEYRLLEPRSKAKCSCLAPGRPSCRRDATCKSSHAAYVYAISTIPRARDKHVTDKGLAAAAQPASPAATYKLIDLVTVHFITAVVLCFLN